jgi:ElaB/YqjD/DUF883 family membrane-anchored ribosome-binding protein
MAVKSDKDETDAVPTEALQAEVAALRADLAELGSMVGKIGKRRASGMKAAAGATARESYAKGEAALDDILGELQSYEEDILAAARERPYAACGLAALFGFLLGMLFRR